MSEQHDRHCASPRQTLEHLSIDFHDLADQIVQDRVEEAEERRAASEPTEEGAWQPFDVQEIKRQQLPQRRRRRRFQKLVDLAGRTIIDLAQSEAVADDRLEILAGEFESGRLGWLYRTPSNILGLYVGGQRVELADEHGCIMEYETVGNDAQPSLRPAQPRTLFWTRPLPANDLLDPDPEQCRRYADACERLARQLPIVASPPEPADSRTDLQNKSGYSLMEPSVKKAYQLYEHAAQERPDLSIDKEVYQYLKEEGYFEKIGVNWTVKSFCAMVRKGRKVMGTQKNRPRSGRTGRNVRSQNEL